MFVVLNPIETPFTSSHKSLSPSKSTGILSSPITDGNFKDLTAKPIPQNEKID